MPTPTVQVSADGFAADAKQSLGFGGIEPSELANLREKEAMLIDKGKRIEAMDANQLAREGRDISELTNRNNLQLAEVRKEIARLSK